MEGLEHGPFLFVSDTSVCERYERCERGTRESSGDCRLAGRLTQPAR
jgi:hypothetical protein